MYTNGYFLDSVIEKVRVIADEPDTNSKYDNSLLVRQFIGSAWAQTLSMLKLTSDSIPLVEVSLSITQNVGRIVIPAWVDSVVRIFKRSIDQPAGGLVQYDWLPRDLMHVYGSGWRIEGNEIVFEPTPSQTDTWTMWAIPSGDVNLHYASGSGTQAGVVTSTTVITLASAPNLGILDQRPNAYAGQILRILSAGRMWQERVIKSYDPLTRQATVWTAFDQGTGLLPANGQPVNYEIAPLGQRNLWDAIAWKVAIQIAAIRKVTRKDMEHLEVEYQRALKGVFDRAKIQRRVANHFDRNTVDNRELIQLDVWTMNT